MYKNNNSIEYGVGMGLGLAFQYWTRRLFPSLCIEDGQIRGLPVVLPRGHSTKGSVDEGPESFFRLQLLGPSCIAAYQNARLLHWVDSVAVKTPKQNSREERDTPL